MLINDSQVPRHLLAIPFSFETLIEIITEKNSSATGSLRCPVRCVKGIPEDAKLVGSWVENDLFHQPIQGGTAYLIFEHYSFPYSLPGERIQEMTPEFRSERKVRPFDGLLVDFEVSGVVSITREVRKVAVDSVSVYRSSPMSPVGEEDRKTMYEPRVRTFQEDVKLTRAGVLSETDCFESKTHVKENLF